MANDPISNPSIPSAEDKSELTHKLLLGMMEDTRRREKEKSRHAWFRRGVLSLLVIAGVGGYTMAWKAIAGDGSGVKTDGPTLAVVQIRGPISSESKVTTGGRVSAAVMDAAKDPNVQRIILYIDTPGGSPVEAERIMQSVHQARETYKKPVMAVIGNLGASAGYMVALSADGIVSGRYSLVGSIGAVIQSWQLKGLLDKFDIQARSYTSGDLKALLNPFERGTEKGEKKAQELVDRLGGQFAALVAERRAGKLKLPIEAYTSGEVWNGEDALRLGLVDATGTLEGLTAVTPELEVVNFGPFENKGVLGTLVGAVQDGVAQGVQALAEKSSFEVR